MEVSLLPRPHPLQGKGSGDVRETSWLCVPTLYHFVASVGTYYFQSQHSLSAKSELDLTSYEALLPKTLLVWGKNRLETV